eukprot:Gb_22741 [translate_table: standard]
MDPKLYNASRSGNIKSLEQVLGENAAALKQVTPQKNTALHLAARAGKAEFVERLCSSERELVTAKNASGNTALHEAAQIGALEIVCKILASDPSTLWLTAADGRTCLHVAAVKGHEGIVDALLAGQRDQAIKLVEIEDNYGNTAMHLAVWGDHFGVVKKLLKLEPQLCYSLNKDHESPLHIAVKLGFLEIVKEIMKDKPDSIEVLSKHGKNVLHLATEIPQMDVVTYLVNEVNCSKDEKDKGCEKGGDASLDIAARNKNEKDRDTGDEIESEPNDIQKEEKTSDNKWCEKGGGDTPLHIAARNKNAQIVEALVKVPGVNKNAINKKGLTPLDIARENTEYYESYRILKMLVNFPPKKKPFLYSTPNVTDPKHKKCNELVEKSFKHRANSELVVAVLLATVSFTAAFTVPGGFYTDDQKDGTPAGTPILIHRLSFKIFIVFDTVAFFLSLFVVLMWQLSSPISTGNMMFFMSCTSLLVCAAFGFIADSFTAAVYVVVVRKVKTLALILLSVGVFTSFCGHVVFLYVATKFMVKRARIQHLLGAQRIEDCLVKSLWTLAEKHGGLDILRSFEVKVRRILSAQSSSEQGFPIDQSQTSSQALGGKMTNERDSNR